MLEKVRRSKAKIVVADDSFDSLQLLSRILRQFVDADIVEARDGPTAWQSFQNSKPQITFLDFDMPECSGIDVLRDIRQIDPKAFVVLVSGLSQIGTVQQALALGVNGFVVKPYTPQRILDVLKKYVAETGDDSLLHAKT